MLEKIARHWGLMNAMSSQVGVDLGAEFIHGNLDRSDLRGAVFSCAQCGHVADCEAFLTDGGCPRGEIPDYCLNKSMISALKA